MNPESMSDRYEAELGKAYSIIQERREHIQELLARTIESEAQNHELNQRLSAIKAEFAMAEEEIGRLKTENAKLQARVEELKPYFEALRLCSSLHPDGYTIVDFQHVWLGQERDRVKKLETENGELRNKMREIETSKKHIKELEV